MKRIAFLFILMCLGFVPGFSQEGSYFENVTDAAGLTGVSGFHISVADVNGDGYPDLLIHKQADGIDPVVDNQFLYLNVPAADGTRKFVDYTTQSGIRANRRGTNDGRHSSFAVFADVDNDGDLDMFSGVFSVDLDLYKDRGDRNDLFLNDGSGHFTLAPNGTFHLGELMNTGGATFLDYDLDGKVDLLIGNWLRNVGGDVGFGDKLYRGRGDGGFDDVTGVTGLDAVIVPSYAVTAADWDNDGYMDLFESNYCRDHSIQWKNNGNGTFSQVQASTNYGLYIGQPYYWPQYGMIGGCDFGSMPRDYNNDGTIDIFELIVHGEESGIHSTVLTNIDGVFNWDFNKFLRPDDPHQSNHRDHYGSWFDFDNDGLADFVLAECCDSGNTGNWLALFKQTNEHAFRTVTTEAGLSVVNDANLRVQSVIPLDYDLDGAEDLLIGFASGDGVQLWRNKVGARNNWLTLSLKGAGTSGLSNRSAIGARVEVTATGKTYTREIYAGNGEFGPQVPLDLTFGLAQAATVDRIRIRWPNSNHTVSELVNVTPNNFITIEENLGHTVRSMVGDVDNFHSGDHADLPPRSQRMLDFLTYATRPGSGQNPGVDLDVGGHDRPVGMTHFFALPDQALITSAKVKFHAKGNDPLFANDSIVYSDSVITGPTKALLPVIALRDLLGHDLQLPRDNDLTLTIDLGKVPVRTVDQGPGGKWSQFPNAYLDLLSVLMRDHQLDLLYGDDATIDYSELTITFVFPNPSNKYDLNGDGGVDLDDVYIITNALNTPAYTKTVGRNDPRDLDGDGLITVADARILANNCTHKGTCKK